MNNLKRLSPRLIIICASLCCACNTAEDLWEAPSITIASSQFDDKLVYTGTNSEYVAFTIALKAPNGLDTLIASLYVEEKVNVELFKYIPSMAVTKFVSDKISFRIADDFVDKNVLIRIVAKDKKGKTTYLNITLSATHSAAKGYFIVNEGGFGKGNASLSYFDASSNTLTNDYFYNANNQKNLGDQAQSITQYNGFGYIVVQASKKVEVIDLTNGKNTATIDHTAGMVSPRYFIGVSETKGYVSDWGIDGKTGTIKVIDLKNNTVSQTIEHVGKGPNRMILVGSKVLVANSGGWGSDNTIKVIDTTTDTISQSITVGDHPNSLAVDQEGNIWIASSGKTVYKPDWSVDLEASSAASISKISSTYEVLFTKNMGSKTNKISNIQLAKDHNTLLFGYSDGIYSIPITATIATTLTQVIQTPRYGFGVNPSNGNIVVCIAPSFTTAGKVVRYKADGTKIDTHIAGIAPNSAGF